MRLVLLSTVSLAIWACSPLFLFAQDVTASLSGVVQDPTGAAIGRNGSVMLEAAGSGVRQMTQPDQRGSFRFQDWSPAHTPWAFECLVSNNAEDKRRLFSQESKGLCRPSGSASEGAAGFSSDTDPVWTHFLATGPPSELWRGRSRMLSNLA